MGLWWVTVCWAGGLLGAASVANNKNNEYLEWTELDLNRGPPPRGDVLYSRLEETCFKNRTVYQGGKCRSLLERGDCGEGEWLVVDPEAAGVRAVCRPVPCPSGQAYWRRGAEEGGRCVDTAEDGGGGGVCTRRETALVINTLGEGECGCKRGRARVMAPSGACYLLYSRGPCGEGRVVGAEPDTGAASCRPDPCPPGPAAPDLLPFASGCHPRGLRGPCPEGTLLDVDVTLLVPACVQDLNQWHLVDAPPLCTHLDHRGDCTNKIDVSQAQTLSFLEIIKRDKAKRRKRNP